MNVQQGYDRWAPQYDSNENKTRDMEAGVLRQTLTGQCFNRILEIGCGTGKNTLWLQTITKELTAVDLSADMLAFARNKIKTAHVTFIQADILGDWNFINGKYDLVCFSLVLEHIESLTPVFNKSSLVLAPAGKIYVSELHPFKQYAGSRARFETENGTQTVPCFNHHISDFIDAAKHSGLEADIIGETFDNDDRTGIPRLLTMVFSKKNIN